MILTNKSNDKYNKYVIDESTGNISDNSNIIPSDLLGKTEEEANDYVKEVIKADFQEAGDEDVYRKLAEDLGNLASEDEIREKMSLLAIKAKDEIMNEV